MMRNCKVLQIARRPLGIYYTRAILALSYPMLPAHLLRAGDSERLGALYCFGVTARRERRKDRTVKHTFEKHKVYSGSNVLRRRESDPPEDDAIDTTSLCNHKNQRGFTYQSKHCPNCGAQLKYDADEKPSAKDAPGTNDDGSAQEERAKYHQTLRAGLSGRK